ncbi:hypothetical protein LIER_43157 [Lithospermum erythrorhizon]|uniref:Gag-protease polyprotein n=1 Tax=Lithospermum erythrorhizon TaxID=34254 RepID=A0AAV3PL04_LITER
MQGNYGAGQPDKPKGIQCRECEGYGHIQVECPNYIKKESKNYHTTFIDDDSDVKDEQEEQVEAERCKLKKDNEKLTKIMIDRDEEIKNLNAQLKALNKGLKMMNSSTNILEEIPEVGKDVGDKT